MTTEPWHNGRVAIVTGGAAGIGLEISRVLAKRGAKVAVGARSAFTSAPADLTDAVAMVGQLDVCDSQSVEHFVAEVTDKLGKPDVLVNAAGISVHQSMVDHSEEDWLSVIETNLNGPFRTIRACLPGMMAAGWGRIVNIASTAATSASPVHAAYCASKTGLLGLGRAVALEGASRGVTCTSVSPTWVETEMLRQSTVTMAAASGRSVAEERAGLAAANPQNRLVQPQEIAELVSFLCSDLSPALTMEDIQVNAGAFW